MTGVLIKRGNLDRETYLKEDDVNIQIQHQVSMKTASTKGERPGKNPSLTTPNGRNPTNTLILEMKAPGP